MDTQPISPNMPTPGGERPGLIMPEQLAAAPEVQPGAPTSEPAAPVMQMPVLPASPLAQAPMVSPAAPMPMPVPGAPAVAGDADVIEPEWVAKADQLVQQHQGDPYGEEEAIEKLQEDYLQKRYGINVADPNGPKSQGS